MQHPKTCFGVSRHNVIIPLLVSEVQDLGDGCYKYTLEVNHPNPSNYMVAQQRADFDTKFISEDQPLCDKYTKVRLTLPEAKELAKEQLIEEREDAMRKINQIDKDLAKIDDSVADLEAAITQVKS